MGPESSRRRWLFPVLVIVIGAVLGYGLLGFVLDRQVAAIESAHAERGESLDFTDFIPAKLPPGAPNASDHLEAMARLAEGQDAVDPPRESPRQDLAHLHERLRELRRRQEAPGEADLEFFREVTERYASVLEVFDDARSIVEARYKTNYDDLPWSIQVPNLLFRMRIASLVRARAHLAIADGRFEEAWHDAAGIFRIAAWCSEEMSTVINSLIARVIAEDGAELVRRLLETSPPGAGDRDSVVAEARRVDPREVFDRALRAERAMTWSSLNDPRAPREVAGAELGMGPSPPSWVVGPWLRLNAIAYERAMTSTRDVCLEPTFRQGEARSADDGALPSWASVASMVFYDCVPAVHKRDSWGATLDMLEIALALDAIRQDTGEFPPSLEALADPSFVDPFSGEAYRYRRDGDGYVLYSVSANRVDDDGAYPLAQRGQSDLDQGDLVWWLVPVPSPDR